MIRRSSLHHWDGGKEGRVWLITASSALAVEFLPDIPLDDFWSVTATVLRLLSHGDDPRQEERLCCSSSVRMVGFDYAALKILKPVLLA